MKVPPDIQIPKVIADLPPLSPRASYIKRMERISLDLRYVLRPTARCEKLKEFEAVWSDIERATLANRLAACAVEQEFGSGWFAKVICLKRLRRKHQDRLLNMDGPLKHVYEAFDFYQERLQHFHCKMGWPVGFASHVQQTNGSRRQR